EDALLQRHLRVALAIEPAAMVMDALIGAVIGDVGGFAFGEVDAGIEAGIDLRIVERARLAQLKIDRAAIFPRHTDFRVGLNDQADGFLQRQRRRSGAETRQSDNGSGAEQQRRTTKRNSSKL